MLEKYVDKALASADYAHITAVGMDETSKAKGHKYKYITLFETFAQLKLDYIFKMFYHYNDSKSA